MGIENPMVERIPVGECDAYGRRAIRCASCNRIIDPEEYHSDDELCETCYEAYQHEMAEQETEFVDDGESPFCM